MNIQSTLSKIYNKIKHLQVEDVDSDNFVQGAYFAGMLDSAKLFMKTYNGELTDEEIREELAKLDNYTKTVN